MTPRIEISNEKMLVGRRMAMSFADYKISSLWKDFLSERKSIANPIGNHLISMAVYPPSHFTKLNPAATFDKWAAVEVAGFNDVPLGMEAFVIPEGLYAVFDYRGSGSDNTIFRYIFNEWLPASDYVLDHRPHFEILGEQYRNNDLHSEEEIWIPIKPRK